MKLKRKISRRNFVLDCQVAGRGAILTAWEIHGSKCDNSAEGGLILRHDFYNSSNSTRHCNTSSIAAIAESLEYDGVYYLSCLTVTIKPTYNKTMLNIGREYDDGTHVVDVDSYSIVAIPCTNGADNNDGNQKVALQKGEINY